MALELIIISIFFPIITQKKSFKMKLKVHHFHYYWQPNVTNKKYFTIITHTQNIMATRPGYYQYCSEHFLLFSAARTVPWSQSGSRTVPPGCELSPACWSPCPVAAALRLLLRESSSGYLVHSPPCGARTHAHDPAHVMCLHRYTVSVGLW